MGTSTSKGKIIEREEQIGKGRGGKFVGRMGNTPTDMINGKMEIRKIISKIREACCRRKERREKFLPCYWERLLLILPFL